MKLLQSVLKVDTVRGHYEGFTKNGVGKDIPARKSQAMIANPSEKDFKDLVSKNDTPLKSIPVNCADITNAHIIFGNILSGVRGGNCDTEVSEGIK